MKLAGSLSKTKLHNDLKPLIYIQILYKQLSSFCIFINFKIISIENMIGFPYTYGDNLTTNQTSENAKLFLKNYGSTIAVNSVLFIVTK